MTSVRLLALGLCALSGGCAARMPPSFSHALVGRPAPPIAERALGGQDVEVPGGFRSRVFVVDFWASWCESCPESVRALDALWERYRGDGLRVVGVAADEDARVAADAARRFGATFPIVLDDYQQLVSRFRVARIPLSFVLDATGTVRWVGRDVDALADAVRAVLAEPSAQAEVF
ncbi:MAG: TlpA family protein disulfide reductase [Myxococcales bacterium]|nr:TlpA family protein disulfide reductase [Myxococcales bacterium]